MIKNETLYMTIIMEKKKKKKKKKKKGLTIYLLLI